MESRHRPRRKKHGLSPVERWNLPHQDAQAFVDDLIDQLALALRQEDSEEHDYQPPDDEDYEEWASQEEAEKHVWRDELDEGGRPPGRRTESVMFDDEMDYEYEKRAEPDDTIVFIRDNLQAAREALAAREIDDLLDVIEALIDREYLPQEVDTTNLDDVQNWAQLLDRQVPPKEPEDGPGKEAEAAVLGAIRLLAERLCEIIAEQPHALHMIEWRQLQQVIAAALGEIGFEVQVTPPSKDGGKDVIACCTLRGQRLMFYVEVKHWRSGKRVGSADVFDFLEVNVLDRTQGGLFISSSGYVDSIWSHLAELYQKRVRLGNRDKIVSLCQHFVRKRKGVWYPVQSLPVILFEGAL